jgi:hypothetical protein
MPYSPSHRSTWVESVSRLALIVSLLLAGVPVPAFAWSEIGAPIGPATVYTPNPYLPGDTSFDVTIRGGDGRTLTLTLAGYWTGHNAQTGSSMNHDQNTTIAGDTHLYYLPTPESLGATVCAGLAMLSNKYIVFSTDSGAYALGAGYRGGDGFGVGGMSGTGVVPGSWTPGYGTYSDTGGFNSTLFGGSAYRWARMQAAQHSGDPYHSWTVNYITSPGATWEYPWADVSDMPNVPAQPMVEVIWTATYDPGTTVTHWHFFWTKFAYFASLSEPYWDMEAFDTLGADDTLTLQDSSDAGWPTTIGTSDPAIMGAIGNWQASESYFGAGLDTTNPAEVNQLDTMISDTPSMTPSLPSSTPTSLVPPSIPTTPSWEPSSSILPSSALPGWLPDEARAVLNPILTWVYGATWGLLAPIRNLVWPFGQSAGW